MSASTSRTWSRSAPTACCTQPRTCAGPPCGARRGRSARLAVCSDRCRGGGSAHGCRLAAYGAALFVVLEPHPECWGVVSSGVGDRLHSQEGRGRRATPQTRWRHAIGDGGPTWRSSAAARPRRCTWRWRLARRRRAGRSGVSTQGAAAEPPRRGISTTTAWSSRRARISAGCRGACRTPGNR